MTASPFQTPNWWAALSKTATPAQCGAVRNELVKAAKVLTDFVVRDTWQVLTGLHNILSLDISRPTTWELPKAVRGYFGREFCRLWLITACNVTQDLVAGTMEVTTVAEALMLDVVFEIVRANAELQGESQLPVGWDQTIGEVMAPPWERDGSPTPVWTDLLDELDPPEWFLPQRTWSALGYVPAAAAA